MKLTIAIATISLVCFAASAAEIFVAPDGNPDAAGTDAAPLATLQQAADKAQPGDVIRLRPGTYSQAVPIQLRGKGTKGQAIRIESTAVERPVIDCSSMAFDSKNKGIEIRGDWWHITGLEVKGAGNTGFRVTGSNNVIENCIAHDCQDSGFQISPPGSDNLILNCDSFHNNDPPTHGENADGFAAKFDIGPGNVFRGCRAWENADDGYDLWKAPNSVIIEDCVAFRNGVNLWKIEAFTGNGNGFKLGGDFVPARHIVRNCVAMDQPVRGFDQNNNSGALTVENCTAIRCKTGFSFAKAPTDGQHVLRNNVSFECPVRIAETTIQENNRWLAPAVPSNESTIP